jgi:Cft2 family RNA processing exonuclease
MKIRLVTLGGRKRKEAKQDIGASCFLLTVEVYGRTYVYMIDIGMESFEGDGVSWRGPIELARLPEFGKLDGIFITHAHRDHVAALFLEAVRSRMKPEARVVCTRPTAAFLSHVGSDQMTVSKKKRERAPYTTRDIFLMTDPSRLHVVMKPEIIDIVSGAIRVFVGRPGHMRGACYYIFEITEGKKVFRVMFSGDYSCHDQMTTLGAEMPPKGWYPDAVIFDCTNGGENLPSWKSEIERMADIGHNTVKGGHHFLIYAFAQDRCQTFARKLADLGLPVWLDGPSAMKITNVLTSADGFWCEGDQPFSMNGVNICANPGEPLELSEASAIVTPSGMGHALAAEYILALIERENVVIGSAGYQAFGTNGYKVSRAKPGDKLKLVVDRPVDDNPNEWRSESVDVTVAAKCEQFRATGHSLRKDGADHAEELLSRSFGPTFIGTHANERALDWFEQRFSHGMINFFRTDRHRDINLAE